MATSECLLCFGTQEVNGQPCPHCGGKGDEPIPKAASAPDSADDNPSD